MPFGLFVGVNNHFQSIVFGAVFLCQETIESFEWAFSTFVAMIQGKAPATMLTDQCAAMEATIRSVLPHTRHRWCRWHVLRKAKEKLGAVYSNYGTFKREFHSLVIDVLCPIEFENSWKGLRQRHIRIGVPIEWNAASVYTRAMFDKFSDELYASGSLTIVETNEALVFCICKALVEDAMESPNWVVKYDKDVDVPRMHCVCGLFEHMGMPCRHMLKVLVHLSAAMIPTGNLHKRWTVSARIADCTHPTIGVRLHLPVADVSERRNHLYLAAMDLMRDGSVSVEGYKAAMKALTDVKQSLRVMAEDDGQHTPVAPLLVHEPPSDSIVEVADGSLLPPLKVKSCGRPTTVRLKSTTDYYGNKRRKTRAIAECYLQHESQVPEKIGDIVRAMEPAKRVAKCGLCGVSGHNRQTCGKK